MRIQLCHVAAVQMLLTLCVAFNSAHGDEPRAVAASGGAGTDVMPSSRVVVPKHKRTHTEFSASAAVPAAAPPKQAPIIQTTQRVPTGDGLAVAPLILPGIVIGFLIYAFRSNKKTRNARSDAMVVEAQAWMQQAKATGKIPPPNTGGVLIQKGERALLAEPSSLFELRADTARHYLGTRVKIGSIPFYVGSSKSVSRKILRETSSGTLALTDKGLIFAGLTRTARIKIADIVGVEPTLDSIVINSGARAAPLVFSVKNPFTWFLAIKLISSGDLTVVT